MDLVWCGATRRLTLALGWAYVGAIVALGALSTVAAFAV